MEGPRPLHENELTDFVDFLSKQLRPNQTWSIADEYPLAMNNANLNNVRVIRDQNNHFLSAAVMKPLVMKTPAGLFKLAAIGSVVTSPESRNQGLSQQVLAEVLKSAEAHGCDFAILWTNLADFYRKLGFELAGTEVSLPLPADFKAPTPEQPLRFMQSAKIDPAAILRLYSQHTTGSLRNIDEIRKSLAIPNSRVFTAWDAQNRLQAYAVEGKGADLGGHIHEWGGGVSKLLPLFEYATRECGSALTVMAPSHATNLIQKLKECGVSENRGVLGMIKILNPSHMLNKMKKHARAMGLEDVVLEARDGKFYLGSQQEIFSTDSTTDLVRLIFGPQKASQLPFDKATAEVFEKIFPINMWVWGWDSV